MKYKHSAKRVFRTVATAPIVVLVTAIVYLGHGKPLTAGLVDLVLVMLIAFRWGFVEAAAASVLSGASLDYFYMAPIFSLYMRDPQDWISSGVFVTIALTAGHFADRVKQKAAQTKSERSQLEKLFLTSRNIITLDRRKEAGPQLAALIAQTFEADAVAIWDAREARLDRAGKDTVPDDDVREVYLRELSENDLITGRFTRVLRVGTKPVGALYIANDSRENRLDFRSVDAIASLTTIALERAHSFIAESNAEAVSRSEELRSTVLDGLAHAFKTPLSTIQSASSGLLEINRLDVAGRKLASLIDEETIRLARLIDQILETSRLDAGQFEADCDWISADRLIRMCKDEALYASADHLLLTAGERGICVWADTRLLQMAILQIVDNALKYASPSSAITLGVASTENEIVFSVENEGSFIVPEERSRIFQRFYRSPGSQHKASGNGIGLSVTKRIAEAHQGRVWVESDSESRTTFFLGLPRIRKEF